ncbi:MAG TPA: ATP-binding protein [Thermofilum sp.]|nr:ATP-binding protein [Thermofilum sp.]
MVMKFINREDELKILQERLGSDRFELIIIYGRRRIGKTRLILESVKDREYVYYLAVESDNLRRFKETASKVVKEIKYVSEDWESMLYFLKDKIVIIDEFPNIVAENKGVLSLFQKAIDVELSRTRTKLVLLGSSVSMMESKVLSYSSPLYGRRTSNIKLGPMRFLSLKGFFPEASWEELVEIYGFGDGIPYYLERIKRPFWKWIDTELKRPDSFLRYEMDFLMKYEFEDVSTYKRILEAIAMGRTKLEEIREYVGLRHSSIMPYLRNLIETGFVVREVPITEGLRSRRGRYFIRDNFTRFWFRYIYPNLSLIEEGVYTCEGIKSSYSEYLGPVFERVAREFLMTLAKKGALPFRPTKLGKWWYKDHEIDLVLMDEESLKIMFVEVKWSDLNIRDIHRLIRDLERKSKFVRWHEDRRKEYYCVIGRRVKDRKVLMKELGDNVLIFELSDHDKLLKS